MGEVERLKEAAELVSKYGEVAGGQVDCEIDELDVYDPDRGLLTPFNGSDSKREING